VNEYGAYVYGVEEIRGRTGLWTSRILLTDTDRSDFLGKCYSAKADGVPWRTVKGKHYIKADCVLQMGITRCISLRDAKGIQFVNHTDNSGVMKLYYQHAARLFLALAVSEQLPSINGFSGIDPDTEQPYEKSRIHSKPQEMLGFSRFLGVYSILSEHARGCNRL
jgi:hypothetical protein